MYALPRTTTDGADKSSLCSLRALLTSLAFSLLRNTANVCVKLRTVSGMVAGSSRRNRGPYHAAAEFAVQSSDNSGSQNEDDVDQQLTRREHVYQTRRCTTT